MPMWTTLIYKKRNYEWDKRNSVPEYSKRWRQNILYSKKAYRDKTNNKKLRYGSYMMVWNI